MFISIPRHRQRLLKPPAGAGINWSHPLNNGLVAFYIANEGGGLSLKDNVSGNYNASMVAASGYTWQSTGLHGLALQGTTVTSANVTMSALPLGTTAPWSWDGYLMQTSNSNADGYAQLPRSPGNAGIFLTNPGPKLNWFQGADHLGTATISVNTWNHLAVVFDGTNLIYYINGVKDSTRVLAVTWGSTGPGQLIGDSVNAQSFIGLMSYQRFWNRAISAPEVQLLFQSPFVNMQIPRLYSVDVPGGVTATFQYIGRYM